MGISEQAGGLVGSSGESLLKPPCWCCKGNHSEETSLSPVPPSEAGRLPGERCGRDVLLRVHAEDIL